MKDRLGTLGQQKGQLSDKEFYRLFLKGHGWPTDTEEDHFLDEMFDMELDRDVEREEALLAKHPEITGTDASSDLFDRIMEKAGEIDNGKMAVRADVEVEREKDTDFEAAGGNTEEIPEKTESAEYRPEDFLSEEDRKALEIGRKRMRNQKKHRWAIRFAVNAAVLVCVFLVGVSTEANRTRLINVINTWVGDEALIKVNNETDRESVHLDQEKADIEIEEKLGIKPVHFMYELKGMQFDGYEIDMKAKMARVFYSYNESIITILMRKDENGTSKGSIKDGNIKEVFDVNTDIGTVKVAEIEGKFKDKYMAEFVTDNTYYHMFGELPREEFVNLIKSIFF
ncbi:MAG: DUF4367 domain-containing protein [Lachnospiraceae bacterium]|nr:DUF4367 domain-containing protein [Lachnospiraceae bacterium]